MKTLKFQIVLCFVIGTTFNVLSQSPIIRGSYQISNEEYNPCTDELMIGTLTIEFAHGPILHQHKVYGCWEGADTHNEYELKQVSTSTIHAGIGGVAEGNGIVTMNGKPSYIFHWVSKYYMNEADEPVVYSFNHVWSCQGPLHFHEKYDLK